MGIWLFDIINMRYYYSGILYLSLIIDLIYEDREREKGGGLIDIGIYWVETYKSC